MSGIIVFIKNNQEMLLDLADFALQQQIKQYKELELDIQLEFFTILIFLVGHPEI